MMEDKASPSPPSRLDNAKTRAFAVYGIIAFAVIFLVLSAATVHTHFKRRRAQKAKPRAILLPPHTLYDDAHIAHMYANQNHRAHFAQDRPITVPIEAHAREPRNVGLPSNFVDGGGGDAPVFGSVQHRALNRDLQRFDPAIRREVLEARESVDTLPRYDGPPAYDSAGKAV